MTDASSPPTAGTIAPSVPVLPTRIARHEQTRARIHACALLCLEGAALGTLFEHLHLAPLLPFFLTQNVLAQSDRRALLVGSAIGVVLTIGCVFSALVWLSAERALNILHTASRAALPVLPCAFYPALMSSATWFREPFVYLLLLSAFGLCFERSLRIAYAALPVRLERALGRAYLGDTPKRRRWALVAVIFAATCYSLYTGYLTVLNHQRFGTGAFDLGIKDNLMFNALHGRPFRSTVLFGKNGGNALGVHAEYIMVLFAPLYALHPAAETLLWLQAVLLGFAAIPLYLFATSLLSPFPAALVTLIYLLYAPVHGSQFYDFHWLTVATFFNFILYWAIIERRTALIIVASLLLLALREDIAPGLVALGLFMLLFSDQPLLGFGLAGASAAWFVVNKFFVMPAFATWWFDQLYKDLIPAGESGSAAIVRSLLTNPIYAFKTAVLRSKLEYLLHLFAPLLFLPLRRPRLLLLFVSGLMFTVLTTGYGPTTSIAYQYTAHWTAPLFAALLLALRELMSRPSRWVLSASTALLAVAVSHTTVFGVVLDPRSFVGGVKPIEFTLTADERAHYRDFNELLRLIPRNASVSATNFEVSHISNRLDAFALGNDGTAAQYLLIDTQGLSLSSTREHVRTLLKEKPYGLVKQQGPRLYLFKLGHAAAGTKEAIDSLLKS